MPRGIFGVFASPMHVPRGVHVIKGRCRLGVGSKCFQVLEPTKLMTLHMNFEADDQARAEDLIQVKCCRFNANAFTD